MFAEGIWLVVLFIILVVAFYSGLTLGFWLGQRKAQQRGFPITPDRQENDTGSN